MSQTGSLSPSENLPPVLIIEDEDDARTMLAEVLELTGYPVRQADTCRAALSVMESDPAALAVIDLRLPDGSGLELMKELKSLHPDLVPLITTGNATLQTAVEAVNHGAFAYLLKPYEAPALLQLLRQASANWTLARENRLLYKQTRDEADRVTALLKASEEINTLSTDSEGITRTIVQAAVRIMAANVGYIGLLKEASLVLREWWDGIQWRPLDLQFREGEGGLGHVWSTRKTVRSEDARNDPRLSHELWLKFSHHTMIACPILTRYGEILGVLELCDKNGGEPFNDEDARFLEGLCRHVAVALENARLYEEMRRSEEQQKQFYRDVICAATHNKLILLDRWELNTPNREPDLSMRVQTAEEIFTVRSAVGEMVKGVFSDENRLESLILCVGEGATNAYKHGNGGVVSAWIEEEHLLVRIEDQGPGIDSTTLPKATLQAGFSTKTSLGMGMTIILDFVDQLNLATDTGGTVMDMVVSKNVQEQDPLELLGLSAYL